MKLIAVLLLVAAMPLAVLSQTERGQTWLANLARWKSFSEERKQELREKYQKLQAMTPEQRRDFFARVERFRNLPAQRRERLREKWELYRTLPPEQQQTIRRFVVRMSIMPPWRRRRVLMRIEMLRRMPSSEREQFLNRTPLWRRLNDSQKDTLRHFLFEQE